VINIKLVIWVYFSCISFWHKKNQTHLVTLSPKTSPSKSGLLLSGGSSPCQTEELSKAVTHPWDCSFSWWKGGSECPQGGEKWASVSCWLLADCSGCQAHHKEATTTLPS